MSSGGGGEATAGPAQAKLDQLALGAAGLACAVYLLHSLPSILFPTGMLASLLTLLAGFLLGLLGAAAALALTFYRLTHPTASSRHGHAHEPLQPKHGRHSRRTAAASHAHSGATVPSDTLPHAIAISGEFSGIVYTAPTSLWRRADTVLNWPPTSDDTQPCKAWQATVSQGTLVLKPIVPPPGAKPPSPRKGNAGNGGGGASQTGQQLALPGAASQPDKHAAATSTHAAAAAGGTGTAAVPGASPAAAAPAAPLTKVGIPLEGCTVELVTDGLKGRSEFIRRAPLLVSHPHWKLLDGEHAFYLFADDPASKQQWVHALGWWCQDAETLAAVEAMYGAYCQAMRDRSLLEYVEHAPPADAYSGGTVPGAGAAAGWAAGGEGGDAYGGGSVGGEAAGAGQHAGGAAAHQGGGKRGWKGWGASKVQTMKKKMGRHRGSGGGGGDSHDGSGGGGGGGSEGDSPAKPHPSGGSGSGGSGSRAHSLQVSPSKPPLAASSPGPGELQSLEGIMEAKWMHSRKIQMPASIPEAVVRSRAGSVAGSRPTSPRAIPQPAWSAPAGAGAELAGSQAPGFSLASSHGALTGGSGGGFITPVLGSSPAGGGGGGGLLGPAAPQHATAGHASWGEAVRRSDTVPPHLGSSSPGHLSSSFGAEALPPGSPLGRPGLPRPPVVAGRLEGQQQGEAAWPGQQQHTGVRTSVSEAAEAPTGTAGGAEPMQQLGAAAGGTVAGGLPQGLPPLVSPDYAVNAFVTRIAFDILRRPDFQELVRARIQRQLSRLQLPPYIQSLDVVGVDMGGAAPTLRGFRALPQPEASIWPQVLFDMRYQGAFTVTIEMKVDIRDAAAWGRLDQALTRLADGKQRPPAAAQQQAAAAGQQGQIDSNGQEEDEEGGDLEPLSPDSSAAMLAAEGREQQQEGGGGNGGGSEGKPRGFMGGIRLSAAKKLRKLAESTAAHISRIPLRLSLTFSVLEGTMCAWVPPPPGNRLFYSFVAPPHLELSARPELAGRFLKYSYHIARVSSWIEQRMRAGITKNMVFPGGGDIPLLPLMGLDHPNAADALPALGRYVQQAAAAASEQQPQSPSPQASPEQPAAQSGSSSIAGGAGGSGGGGSFSADGAAGGGNGTAGTARTSSAAVASKLQADAAAAPVAAVMTAALAAPAAAGKVDVAAANAGLLAAQPPTAQEQPRNGQQQAATPPVASAAPADSAPAAATAVGLAAVPLAVAAQQAGQVAASQAAASAAAHRGSTAGEVGGGGTSLEEELSGEASLSQLPSPQQVAAAAVAAEATAAAAAGGRPQQAQAAGGAGGGVAKGGGGGSHEGHLISPRLDCSGSGDFQLRATPPPLASHGHASADASSNGGTSATDAWDTAMAQEIGEAPTPRFSSPSWRQQQQQRVEQQQQVEQQALRWQQVAAAQQQQQQVHQAEAGLEHLQQQWEGQVQQGPLLPQQAQQQRQRRRSLQLDAHGQAHQQQQPADHQKEGQQQQQAARQQQQQQQGQQQRRPSLHLKLSATRSLDPDFTCSAEHTRFGEAPPNALPDYGATVAVRRTLSARSNDSGSTPGSARAAGAAAAAVTRSLAYLRQKGSSLKQEGGQQQRQGGGSPDQQHLLQQQPASSPPQQSSLSQQSSPMLQQQQASPSQQQQQLQSSPQQQEEGSPSLQQQQAGGSAAASPAGGSGSDPRALRQQKSLKEQAGKFMNRFNAASKAFASQVQHMQQQRAAAGGAGGGGGLARTTSSGGANSGNHSGASSARSEHQEAMQPQ